VVVVPSRWPENCPYAVLEAQASGRAVVASAMGGIPELIDDGVDGRVVADAEGGDLAEAVDRLLDDPVERTRLGSNGRGRVREKNDVSAWAATVEALVAGL
jgi:glycosyltransferase involved in cell wall biosynthesis